MDSPGPLSEDGLVRLLSHTGDRVFDPKYTPIAADLDFAALRAMWREMTIVRAFDVEATALQRQGELALWVPIQGQEGIQIGSGHALTERDWIFPAYREHALAFLRGIELAEILKTFRGLNHSSWEPQRHRFNIYSLVIGAHTLHATGFAMAMDRDGLVGSGRPDRDAAVICFFGDGATSEGDVNEALIFAAVNNAPIVFVCQNNQYAISEPTTRQAKVPLVRRAGGVGIPGVRVDGNDVLASYAVSKEALERARSGGGPTFIEALTYRMGAHTTSDDPTRYRPKAEEDYWLERDPIARLTAHLERAQELPAAFQEEVREEARAYTAKSRALLKAATPSPARDMFDHVYAEPHAIVDAERAWFERYERTFVDSEAAH